MSVKFSHLGLVSALLFILAGACAPGGTPMPPTFTMVPVEDTMPPPTQAPPTHRIGVRVVDGIGEFYDRLTGQKFVPRGNNYVRLAPMEGTPGGYWHSTLNPGFYDSSRAEEALRTMHSDGYNVVRVRIDCCRKSSDIGDPAGGLSSAYLDNVMDFLARAKAHDVLVFLNLGAWPVDGGYSEVWQSCCSIFDGQNLLYLTLGGNQTKRRFVQDFIRALISRNAPPDSIFAFDLTDEGFFEADRPPLSLTSGLVATANGRTYDMAKPEDKQRMMDENLVYWIDQLRAAILDLDPTALVTASFFWPQKPHPARIGDPRVIRTYPAIWESTADFITLHPYPGWGLTLPQYVDNFEMAGMQVKPIVMGEFGAPRSSYASAAGAAQALHDWQVQSCAFGFDGWLLWTWDSDEQADFYNAMGDGGLIGQALAPVNRPDPCQPGAFPFFENNLALGRPVRASRSLPDKPPSNAVDGLISDSWIAGAGPTQWIEIDLGVPSAIRLIRLVVSQSPPGDTLHQLWVGPAIDELYLLHVFEGPTADNQVLEFSPEAPLEGVRYVRVVTRRSPSWVSWREIEVLAP